MSSIPRLSALLALSFVLQLAGCTANYSPSPSSTPISLSIQGNVHGGNQPVVGAHVYLMAATVSGVGSAGYGLASTSLLNSALTGHSDSVGAYVLTDSTGSFSLDTISSGPVTTYDYSCPSASTQVYLYAQGGNPGGGINNAASFMAALGSCGNLSSNTYVLVNEITTVAAAYALAGFATDALHISVPQYVSGTTADTLAQTDLQNAFATVSNLVNSATGAARATTLGGNGTGFSSQLITLANILAACVNSNGATTNPSNCYTLFQNTGSTGGSTGTIPTETATAAINIAHNPWVSSTVRSNLFGLQAAAGAPFNGGDSGTPTDFTIAITYSGGGLNGPISIAIDASGNVWTANYGNSTVSKFSNTGSAISPSTGYTSGGLDGARSIAIDDSGNAWVANLTSSSLSEFTSAGSPISSSSGYTGGGLNGPISIAIDTSGNVWAANNSGLNVSEFAGTGMPISSSSGYTTASGFKPSSIAIDTSGNVWTGSSSTSSIGRFSSTGTLFSSYTGGGLNTPYSIAIDASGNVWAANQGYNVNSLSKLSNIGVAISPTTGYTGGGLNGPISIAIDGAGKAWATNDLNTYSISNFSSDGTPISSANGYPTGNNPYSVAIDGAGNVWVANSGTTTMTELIGIATPVVTPIVANLIAPYSAPSSRP